MFVYFILESTTYPGTTEEEIVPLIKDAGFEIGENYFVGYSPEREDPGNKNFTTKPKNKAKTNDITEKARYIHSVIHGN